MLTLVTFSVLSSAKRAIFYFYFLVKYQGVFSSNLDVSQSITQIKIFS